MKKCNWLGKPVILTLAVVVLIAPQTVPAGSDYDYSRRELSGNSGLQIFRVADYGYENGLCVYLDGIPLTTLGRGEGYRAIVRPGRHLLTLINTPSPYGKTKASNHTIDLKPGQNQSFTAIWQVENILLEDGGYQHHGFYR